MKLKNGWTKRDRITYRHHLYGSIIVGNSDLLHATDHKGTMISFSKVPLKQAMKYLQDKYLDSCKF